MLELTRYQGLKLAQSSSFGCDLREHTRREMRAISRSCGFPCLQAEVHHNSSSNNNCLMLTNSAPSLLPGAGVRPIPTALTVGAVSRSSVVSRALSCRGSSRNCWQNNKLIVKANSERTETSSTDQQEEEPQYEEYEVVIEKPYGLKFVKGRDGGTYIDAIAPDLSADKTGKFSVGDKVLATSAVFGEEVWPAAGYGQTMYTIRQRVGPLYMKMQKRYGKLDNEGELTQKEIIRAERNAGFISNRVREIQLQNYQKKMEQKERRVRDLREGLQLYKEGKYEEAREKFESVLGSKPTPDEASVASYNVACCYSKLNQIQAGLSALEDALEAGYEDFKRIRTDPDLANLRTSEEFEVLMKRFDESFINENAINAIKTIFGIFNKK